MSKRNHFSRKFDNKVRAELESMIDNDHYQIDAQMAAIWELERRGEMSSEEVQEKSELLVKIETEAHAQKEYNITDDPSAPELYHPRFILAYGILFSVFFGGVLIALNLNRINKGRLIWITLLISIVYSILQIIILNLLNTSLLTLVISGLGMALVERLFWTRHVPDDLKFRKRSIWVPVIVAILIHAPLTYLIIISRV